MPTIPLREGIDAAVKALVNGADRAIIRVTLPPEAPAKPETLWTPTPNVTIQVIKGSRRQGLNKSAARRDIHLEAIPDAGVKVHGLGVATWLRGWREIPALRINSLLHCCAGDPYTFVTLKVVAIGSHDV